MTIASTVVDNSGTADTHKLWKQQCAVVKNVINKRHLHIVSLPSEAVPVPVLTRNIKLDTKLKRFPCDFSGLGLKVTRKYSSTSVIESLRKPLTGFCESACIFMLACLLGQISWQFHFTKEISKIIKHSLLHTVLINYSKPSQPTSYAMHEAYQNWQHLPVARYFWRQCDEKIVLCCNLSCTSHEQFVIMFRQ